MEPLLFLGRGYSTGPFNVERAYPNLKTLNPQQTKFKSDIFNIWHIIYR